jgi:16S rRNA U1498 N3-methylase RsmE
VPVTLGSRVLRAETASLAVASAILYAQGDLG